MIKSLPTLALGLVFACGGLLACAEKGLDFTAEDSQPIAVPATLSEPALIRPAGPADILGAWENLTLPHELRQPSEPLGRFAAPWQWYLFLSDGRLGVIASAKAPRTPVTTGDLRAELTRSPDFLLYEIGGGRLKIEPTNLAGYSFRGRQIWRVERVLKSGLSLGIDLKAGDLVMTLIDAAGEPLYYRALRPLPAAAE